MADDFWQGRRVLVTGHTGFKGSWMCLWLQQLGAEVTGLALEPLPKSLFEAASVGDAMTSIIGDIRDLDTVKAAYDQANPQVVIHLAAQALVHTAYADPITNYGTNVMGTAHVLEAARDRDGLDAVLMITSDKCYRNVEWVWGYRESDELGGRDPYSASKGAAELVIRSYMASWFDGTPTAVASARAGNVIGGGDWSKDRLIPDIMAAIDAGEPVQIRNPHALRPWQHVLEPVGGYLRLAEVLTNDPTLGSDHWNIGPDLDQIKPVEWIAEYLTNAWGDGASWQLDGKEFPHEDTFLKLDCAKIKSQIGWNPILGLDDALTWIVEWYRTNHDGGDVRAMTLDQIDRYRKLLES